MVGFFGTVVEGLTLYTRQAAWLATAPAKAKGDTSEEPALSRIARQRADREDEDWQPPMPEIEAAHLVRYLFEAGPAMPGVNGPVPVTHQEIDAWRALTGVHLTPWEARVIRRLSQEYVSEAHKAEKPDCPAPWTPVDYVPDLSGVAKSMRKAMSRLVNL